MLAIRDLRKAYKDFELIIPALDFKKDCVYGVVGRNAAGKTTLMRCVLSLTDYEGTVTFDEHKISDMLLEIGYVAEALNINNELTMKQAIAFVRSFYKGWDETYFRNLISKLLLSEHENKLLSALSRGTRVKLSVALALAHHPLLIILDEPTSGLDPAVRSEILSLIKEETHKHKTICIFSTHILGDIKMIADEIIVLNAGRIMNTGSMDIAALQNSDFENVILEMLTEDRGEL